MSEEYSNGYARGYEAGQQSVLKLAEQPAPVQQPLSRIESAAAKAVNYRTDYQKPLTDRLEQLAEWYDFLKEEVQRLEVALVRQQEQPAQPEPVVCMKCGVQLGGLHLATGDGSCPAGWRVQHSDCTPQPAQQECTCTQGQVCGVCDPIHPPAAQQSVEAYSEIVAARFEAMQERGDAWITTRAAAAIARDPRIPRIRVKEECQHSWTEESRANGWRSSCRLCGKEAAGSGQ